MNIEKKRIEAWETGKGTIGHITLDKLAIPETVKVEVHSILLGALKSLFSAFLI